MTPDQLVNASDAERLKAINEADAPTLRNALQIAIRRGAANAAAAFAYELGRRDGFPDEDVEF